MPEITVELGDRSYPILIGTNISRKLSSLLRSHVGDGRLFVFYDVNFYALHAITLKKKVPRLAKDGLEMVLPEGESTKSPGVLKGIYDFLLSNRISRSDFVLAVGGGVTSDVTGYAASTVLRGVRWGVMPTTLLGMVDAGIGGKTGINHTAGKNLVGSFWQPSFVCSDITFLATLDDRQMVSGLGEVIKCAGLVGDNLIKGLDKYLGGESFYRSKFLTRIVSDSAACKADIVSRDENESGTRMLLNFGHTFGHGIEHALKYKGLLHGEAVILGILAALELSAIVKPRAAARLGNYRALVEKMARLLPFKRLDRDKVLGGMQVDKKRIEGAQKYVLLDGPGRPFIDARVKQDHVVEAVDRMLSIYKSLRNKDV